MSTEGTDPRCTSCMKVPIAGKCDCTHVEEGVMKPRHREAHDALGRLMHSDEITDAHAKEIQNFVLRLHGMMRENR